MTCLLQRRFQRVDKPGESLVGACVSHPSTAKVPLPPLAPQLPAPLTRKSLLPSSDSPAHLTSAFDSPACCPHTPRRGVARGPQGGGKGHWVGGTPSLLFLLLQGGVGSQETPVWREVSRKRHGLQRGDVALLSAIPLEALQLGTVPAGMSLCPCASSEGVGRR